MKKNNKLRKNYDFQRVINSRQSHVSKYLVIYFFPNKSELKAGISISKKFINAVGRNKIRRQVRSILDEINSYDKKYDIVLIIRKPFINAEYSKKKKAIDELLKRI